MVLCLGVKSFLLSVCVVFSCVVVVFLSPLILSVDRNMYCSTLLDYRKKGLLNFTTILQTVS